MEFIKLLLGNYGMLVGVGALLGGLAAFIREISRLTRRGEKMSLPTVLKIRRTWVGKMAILLLVVSSSVFAGRAFTQDLSKNALLTKRAWDPFNEEKYEEAIRRADECIDEFVKQARRDEEKLEEEKAPLPPTGKVADQDKETIIERGVLNDVATCYYIKGRSLEYVHQIEQAKKTYQETRKFPHGRCWDPKGWFWSPAQAANDRLERLAEKEKGGDN